MSSGLSDKISALLTGLPRPAKLAVLVAADASITFAIMFGVTALLAARLETAPNILVIELAGPITVIAALAVFGNYRAVTRFLNLNHLITLSKSILVAAAMLLVVALLLSLPSSTAVVIALFCTLAFAGLSTIRLVAASLLRPIGLPRAGRERVLIYGAGGAGTQLASALMTGAKYRVAGFVDDDKGLQKRTILGCPVYSFSKLQMLKAGRDFDLILLAMPSQPQRIRRKILESLESLAARVLVMPGLDELASNSRSIEDVREVAVSDLLGRDPVAPDERLMDACIRGQVVLVTGGGGSIGSELARQAVSRGARKLVLLELSEHGLYQIERELRLMSSRATDGATIEIVPVLGSVLDRRLIRRVIKEHQVDTIYHAAAYKHVPLVESNPLAGIQNNIFGTLVACDEAGRGHVKRFVLVSTDKAVRPTSVMGAAKRVAELVVQSSASKHREMACSIVRFGNVLASSGSVVPLFQEQLKRGGPITVTHPSVTRYFMTIPEAAQLVIHAGAMGHHGDVFLLDMGEPVRILDLAQRMVHLAGLQVRGVNGGDEGIEIKFTGLRPGEKLYEELLIDDLAKPTSHTRIFFSPEPRIDEQELREFLEECKSAIRRGDPRTVVQTIRKLGQGSAQLTQPRDLASNPREVRKAEPRAGKQQGRVAGAGVSGPAAEPLGAAQ